MSNVPVQTATGPNIATNAITRDSVTEHLQLINMVDVTGVYTLTPDASGRMTTTISDGILPNQKVSVQQFHNSDNQALATTAYGILSGGVAQLLNVAGNLDRQRETATDNVPALGISAGAQNLASPITVTSSTAIASGALSGATITLSTVSGTNRGALWNIVMGSTLVLSSGTASAEPTYVSNVSGNVVTLYFSGPGETAKYAHSGTYNITTFVYNQARDATTPDGSTGAGFSAGATFLFNSGLNSNAGGWESERSAAGELDGASGTGTAIAAEYEFNGGGPLISGIGGMNNYDRARSLQGKLLNSTALVGTFSSGASAITLASVSGLLPGMPILLRGGTQEVVYVSSVYTATATASSSVPLQSVTQQSHNAGTGALFESYATNGPGLNGFTAIGMGIEEDVVYSPTQDLYYIERSADADGVAVYNLPLEAIGGFNGSTFDRLRVDPNATGVLRVTTGGALTASVPATNGNTVIKNSAGRLCKIMVTTAGSAASLIYDNASTNSGTVIGYIPASATIGTIIDFSMPAANGITAACTTSTAVFTVSYY